MSLETFKIIVVGNSGVGKTSLIRRFVSDEFTQNKQVTLGLDFLSKVISIEGTDVIVQIWDTAGQEIFRSLIRQFYQKASAVILVYSVAEYLFYLVINLLNNWKVGLKN